MGSVGDAYDNAMCESFFATLDASCLRAGVSKRRPLFGAKSTILTWRL